MAVTQYIGARYVPVFADPSEWDNTRTYEPLTIVLHNGASYTSAQYVPVGIDILNTEFWQCTGNYNAQVEKYREEVNAFDERITTNADAITAETNRASAAEKVNADAIKAETSRASAAETELSNGVSNALQQISAFDPRISTLETAKFRGGSIFPTLVGSCNKPSSEQGSINWSIQSMCAKDENTLVVCGIDYSNQKHNFFTTIHLDSNQQTYVERTFEDFSSHCNSIYWDSEKNMYIIAAGNTDGYYIVGLDSSFNFVKSWNIFGWAFDRDPVTGKRYSIFGGMNTGDKVYIAELDSDFNRVATHELPHVSMYMGVFQSFRVVNDVFYIVVAQGVYIYKIESGIITSYNNGSDIEFEAIAFADGGTYLVGNTNETVGNPGFAVYKIGINSEALGTQGGLMELMPQWLNLNNDNTFWFQTTNPILHTISVNPLLLSRVHTLGIKNIDYINIKRSTSIEFVDCTSSYVVLDNSRNFAIDMHSSTLNIIESEGSTISIGFDTATNNTVIVPKNSYFDLHFRTSAKNVTFDLTGDVADFRFNTSGSIDGIVSAFGHNDAISVNTPVTDTKFCKYALATAINRGYLNAIIVDGSSRHGVLLHSSNEHRFTWVGSEIMSDGKEAIVSISLSDAGVITLNTCTIAGNSTSLAYIY